MNSFEINDSQQYSSVHFLLKSSWLSSSKMNTSSDVCGSVKVLTTRIQKVDLLAVHVRARIFLRFIMNNGTVFAN